MKSDEDFLQVELYAWLGEDEFGSGQIGIKQGKVPAGCIPIVSLFKEKISRPELIVQLEQQAQTYGNKIRLVRFKAEAIIDRTHEGE